MPLQEVDYPNARDRRAFAVQTDPVLDPAVLNQGLVTGDMAIAYATDAGGDSAPAGSNPANSRPVAPGDVFVYTETPATGQPNWAYEGNVNAVAAVGGPGAATVVNYVPLAPGAPSTPYPTGTLVNYKGSLWVSPPGATDANPPTATGTNPWQQVNSNTLFSLIQQMKNPSWYTGTTDPGSVANAVHQDYYVNTATGDVFHLVDGTWIQVAKVREAVAGVATDPNTIAPTPPADGWATGDIYIDTTNNKPWVFDGTANRWTQTGALKAAGGAAAAAPSTYFGSTGAAAPAGTATAQGDQYLNTTNGDIYVADAALAWQKQANGMQVGDQFFDMPNNDIYREL